MTEETKDLNRDARGRFGKKNPYRFQPGESGNPNGRPKKSQILKDLDADLGAFPRQALYELALAAMTGEPPKDENGQPLKLVGTIKGETLTRILMYLDEQANGRAKQKMEMEGLTIVLPSHADQL